MLRTVRAIWDWVDDRTGFSETLGPLAKHAVPPTPELRRAMTGEPDNGWVR